MTTDLRNTGQRVGAEVAQLYLDFPNVPGTPNIALRGFRRINLAAGESAALTFDSSPRDLSAFSVRTAYKWLARYRAEGPAGLFDRSSRPRACPHQTPSKICDRIIELRRQRRTYRQISQELGVAQSTVGRLLARAGPTHRRFTRTR